MKKSSRQDATEQSRVPAETYWLNWQYTWHNFESEDCLARRRSSQGIHLPWFIFTKVQQQRRNANAITYEYNFYERVVKLAAYQKIRRCLTHERSKRKICKRVLSRRLCTVSYTSIVKLLIDSWVDLVCVKNIVEPTLMVSLLMRI